MSSARRTTYLIVVFLGVLVLLAKSWFSDWLPEVIIAYAGNVSVSFAIYFIFRLGSSNKLNKVICALLAMAVVGFFELTNGFGFMANVYDPMDLIADALGISLALLADVLTERTLIDAN